MELDPLMLYNNMRKTGGVAIIGMIVPFVLGIGCAVPMFDALMADDPMYQDVPFIAYAVFIATALSITAFPVLARILKEGGLIYTEAGSITMGAAAINDAIAWCLLILAVSIANSGDMRVAGYVFGSVCAFAVGMFCVIGPMFHKLVEKVESYNSPKFNNNLFVFTLVLVFLSAWVTALLGVHAIFGGFLAGIIIPRQSKLHAHCNEYLEEYVLTLALPLYFTLSGIQTDITTIRTGIQGAMVILVCAVATFGKYIGAGVTAYAGGLG